MIYEPFLGMHVLVSDDLLQVISASFKVFLLLCVVLLCAFAAHTGINRNI